MISTSTAWRKAHDQILLPETFVEISCGITDLGISDVVTATGEDEAVFSDVSHITESSSRAQKPQYATLEHNLWVLDGSRSIFTGSSSFIPVGYANNGNTAKVTLSLDEERNVPVPGLTITWSSEYGQYPTSFNVVVKLGDTVVASASVTDNASVTTEVALEFTDYDSVEIEVMDWCLPDHRARIETISFGHVLVFGKNDVLSYSHEQNGCLNSGEISKNSINFTLDNTDGRWNPSNPAGIERYLSERQPVTVRYGLAVGDTTEWIVAGKFFLSEWRAPSNGLEASFAARDIFEYLLNETYTGVTTGTFTQLITEAFESADVPRDFEWDLDPILNNYSATVSANTTAAEVVQMCANAACCVIWQDRLGVLHVKQLDKTHSEFYVPAKLSYSHPEVELSKSLKGVAVDYGEEKYELAVGSSGETQTVSNPYIVTQAQASNVASWVRDVLEPRKIVTGEFRADPRLDLFDIVGVASKYGTIDAVALTNVTYTYTGAFRANYTGRVIDAIHAEADTLGSFILGTSVLG